MTLVNRVLRFLFVLIFCAVLFSIFARMMDSDDARWTTGVGIWGAAIGLGIVDAYFRSKAKQKE